MMKPSMKKQIGGLLFLSLALACALVFLGISAGYPAEYKGDPESILSFSGVDLYAFAKTAALFFGAAILCLLGVVFGVITVTFPQIPLMLGGFATVLLNLGLLGLHLFQHGGFLLAMLEAL